jgi:hypothetical protein
MAEASPGTGSGRLRVVASEVRSTGPGTHAGAGGEGSEEAAVGRSARGRAVGVTEAGAAEMIKINEEASAFRAWAPCLRTARPHYSSAPDKRGISQGWVVDQGDDLHHLGAAASARERVHTPRLVDELPRGLRGEPGHAPSMKVRPPPQNSASGLAGEPVPPMTMSGAITSMNSSRPSSTQARASGSSSALSRSATP